jgi:hypothetical protein
MPGLQPSARWGRRIAGCIALDHQFHPCDAVVGDLAQ